MKKILITLGAVLAFGAVSAQVAPGEPARTTTPDELKATDAKKIKDIPDASVDNTAATPARPDVGTPPESRKDEIKTRDHVKSTPEPSSVNDKDQKKMRESRKAKRKSKL